MPSTLPPNDNNKHKKQKEMDIDNILELSLFGITVRAVLRFCIKAVLIYIFVRLVTSLVKYFFNRSLKKQGRLVALDETKTGFIRQMVVAAVYIIGCAAFLSLIPGMEKISSSILASAGIMAMAVGLASQEALSNIVGGMFIVFSRPFKVGDFIKVDDIVVGTVMEITLRHTVIRNAENRMILIPNSKMSSSTIVNSSYGEEVTCAFVEGGVSYTTDLDFAMDVMRDEIMHHPMLTDHRTEKEKEAGVPEVMIRVINLGDSAITLRAWAWAATPSNAFAMKCDLLKSIKERFDKENIEIPYPYFNQIVMNQKA